MNNKFNEDFNCYIEERINNNISSFKKSNKWKELYNKFSQKYEYIIGNLNNITQKELEELYAIFNDLSAQEQYLVYKIGFLDGINISGRNKEI